MDILKGKWIGGKDEMEAPLFVKYIECDEAIQGEICVCGLGWFELYLNGKKVSDDLFAPAVSQYVAACEHTHKILEKPRKHVYYLKYTLAFEKGENKLEFLLGNGFFNQNRVWGDGNYPFGAPRLLYCLQVGDKEYVSDETTLVAPSIIASNNLYFGEAQVFPKGNRGSLCADESRLESALLVKPYDGELTLWPDHFPKDRIIRKIKPVLIHDLGIKKIYDVGENITGLISFDNVGAGKVVMQFSEELLDGDLDFSTVGGVNQIQEASYVFEDDFRRNVMPHFTWHGFRYFSVEGEAENLLCNVIHTDVKVSSDFHCENPVVNWYYDAYKRSQLGNYHGCMPSDCPHIERLGYTGDGQITCETALLTFDSANLYRKWMRDILDSQNVDTGHVPHTAPFMGGGGGPCGWGGVVVILPYNFYQVTGSLELAEQYFDAILRWFDYIDTKSEAYFVVDEEPRLWCLGDWCIPKEGKNDPDMLDRPFVNTCYLVRCYDMASEMALAMGKTTLAAQLKEKGEIRRKALNDKYFDRESGDFLGNKYGSNAYAVDTGLGDERTLQNLFAKYEQMDGFDTGIFGTEILLRTLGKHGRADIAFHLLNSRKDKYSFGHMMESGATTIWEYYNGRRSHNHPMFGGSVKILFTDFLGIKRLAPGYKKVRIAPADIPQLGETYGYITTPYGKIEVHVHRENGNMRVDVKAPAEVEIIE